MRPPAGSVVDPAAVPPEPWRNGGGTTRTLWTEPGTGGDFAWRVSLADIAANGPFSVFPGVDRELLGVSGAQVTLLIADRTVRVRPRQPVAFDGGSSVAVRRGFGSRGRPSRVLNMMTARAECAGGIGVVSARGAVRWDDEVHAVVLLHGLLTVAGEAVPPLGLARLRPGGATGVATKALVAEIRVRPPEAQ